MPWSSCCVVSAEAREQKISHGVETCPALLQEQRNIYSYIGTASFSPLHTHEVKHVQLPVWLKGTLGKKKNLVCRRWEVGHTALQVSISPPMSQCPTLMGCLRSSQGVPLEEKKHDCYCYPVIAPTSLTPATWDKRRQKEERGFMHSLSCYAKGQPYYSEPSSCFVLINIA